MLEKNWDLAPQHIKKAKAWEAAKVTMARTRRNNITDQLVDPEDSESNKEVARVKIVKNKKPKSKKVNSVHIVHDGDAENSTEEMNRFIRETVDLDNTTWKQVNTFSINGVHNESEQGLAWKSANSPKHKVSVLLDTGSGTNLISTKCCTRMGLRQPLPFT